jgi:hypothetical protein
VNGTVTTSSGNVKPKITTQGWQLLVFWKDKSTSWVKLKDLKASNPVELAEYAVAGESDCGRTSFQMVGI